MVPLQGPDGGTTIKEPPICERAMDSNLGIVATRNTMNPVTLGTANASLIRRSPSFLVRHGLTRGESPTCLRSTCHLGLFFIYCHTSLHRPTADVSKLHSRARGMLRFIGPFIHVRSTFNEGSRLASTVATSPESSM